MIRFLKQKKMGVSISREVKFVRGDEFGGQESEEVAA